MSYWSIFERNLVGLADFAASNANGWPTGSISIKKSNLGELYETGGLFGAIHPVSIKKSKLGIYETGGLLTGGLFRSSQWVSIKKIATGPVGHPMELRGCKMGPSHY